MRRQKCSQCGTMLDVTKLEKGAKFACANCGTILTVGEAAVVKRSLDQGPAFQPRAKGEDAPAAPARARRSRAPAADAGPKKSKAPIFIGVAVVVVGIGVAVALNMGGNGGGSGGETAQSWWAARSAGIAEADPATIRAWIREAETKGYTKDRAFWGPKSDLLMQRILEKDPADAEANRSTGRVDLRTYPELDTVWEQMDESYRVLSDEQKQVFEKYGGRVVAEKKPPIWVASAEFDSVSAVLDGFVEWRSKQGENPAAPRVAKATATAQQLLGKDYQFATAAEWPWVVVVALPAEEAARKDELTRKAQGYVKALALLKATYDEKIAKPLGLPAVDGDTFFTHLVCLKKDDVARLARDGRGLDREGDVAAYFSTDTRWFHVWLDPENEGRVASDLCHGAVHQLQWFHSKDPKDKYENHFEKWAGLWLTEGIAEWLGSGIRFDPATGKADWTGIAERRASHLQSCKDVGWPLFPLRELVQIDSIDTLRRNAGSIIAATVGDVSKIPEAAHALVGQDGFTWHVKTLHAQAWHLAYFMNEYEQGKYKAKFQDLVRTALAGKRKPEAYRGSGGDSWSSAYDAFAAIFGTGNDAAAWERLDREYADFVNTALRKARG